MLIQVIKLIGFVLHFEAVSRGNIDLLASMPVKIFKKSEILSFMA
jgi:hypothetical protein